MIKKECTGAEFLISSQCCSLNCEVFNAFSDFLHILYTNLVKSGHHISLFSFLSQSIMFLEIADP